MANYKWWVLKVDVHAIKVGEILSDVETKHGFPLNKLSLSLSRLT